MGCLKDCSSLEKTKSMDPSSVEQQLPDLSGGIVSPQSSVDASSRDRAMVTEGKPWLGSGVGMVMRNL